VKLLLIILNRKYMKFFRHPSGVEVFHWLLKKLTIMKLIIALILIFNLNSFGRGYSQTRITLDVRGTELKKVLGLIERQSDYHFLFSDRRLPADKKVDLRVKDEEVLTVLNQLLSGAGFTYYELNNKLIVITQAGSANADKIQVTGKVLSDKGVPLGGATVRVKGTSIGIATDSTGAFTINVERDATLVISFLGYQTAEIPVGGRPSLTIALQATTASMDEVVVVGYGQQKKIDLTGSVASLDGDKDLAWKPVGQVSESLQGTVSGVTVTQGSGQPGSDQGTIRIRGIGTFNDNDPLVLVDGVQYNINDVDVNDIATVSVLKDAAASAIYGIRAANGVILITTKRGLVGKSKISYADYFGWQKPTRLSDYVGAQEYMNLSNELYENGGGGAVFTDSAIAQYNNPQRDLDLYPNNDWIRLILIGSGFQQQHSLSLSGGAQNIKYRFSTNYFDQKGLIENMDFQRLTVRLNTDINVTSKLVFSADISARLADQTMPQDNGSGSAFFQFSEANVMNPTLVNKYSDGTWGIGRGDGNPIRIQQLGPLYDYKSNLFTGNFRANYEVIKGLTLTGMAQVNYTSDYNSLTTMALPYYNFFVTPHTLLNTVGQNTETKEYGGAWFRDFQGLAEYHKDFGAHSFKILGGLSSLSTRYDSLSGYRLNLTSTTLTQLNAYGANGEMNSGTANEYDLVSFFGRLNYAYKDKYLLEANLRRDGSSRFFPGQQWGTFPSFSAGWRLSAESFMQDQDFFQDLKVRGSWGELGNDNTLSATTGGLTNYPYQSTYVLNNYPFGGTLNAATSLNAVPNNGLTWETTKMTDVGLDMTILHKRLDVTADYYVKNTDNILYQLPVPETVGFNPSFQNAFSMRNKGWEVAAAWHGNAGKDFRYNVNVNLSDVLNKVTNMHGADYEETNSNGITQGYETGKPIGAYYGYQATGIFKSAAQVAASPTQPSPASPGDLIYADVNKLGVVSTKDWVYLGSNIPRYTYGANLGAGYKGFDLSALLQGVGKVAINDMIMRKAPTSTDGNFKSYMANAWTAANPNATYPRLSTGAENYTSSSYWIQSGAYLRLKSVQLGYNLPGAWLQKAGFSRLRFYVSGQNLLTFSKLEKDIDPEAPNDNRYYPQVKTYTFGCNVDF
jgi:TonB-linked SusC/RagA family outer membrane protein